MRSNPNALCRKTGEWGLLSAHLPGWSPEPVAILLIDAGGKLHVRMRPNGPALFSDSDDGEFWSAVVNDLEQKGREWGAQRLLDWLDDTASHVLQLSRREKIEIADLDLAMGRLYEQYIERTHVNILLHSASNRRSRVWMPLGVAAALIMTVIIPVTHTRRGVDLFSNRENGPGAMRVLPLLAESLYRPSRLTINPIRQVRYRHARRRNPRPKSFMQFRFDPAWLKLLPFRSVWIDSPPSYDISEMNAPSVLQFELPAPPPFQMRRNRFVQILYAIASPFKRFFLPHGHNTHPQLIPING